jgi:RHS repeat-associated protein
MISSLRHTKDSHDLARRDYWRDDRDRITAWKRGLDQTLNPMENGTGDRYGYDAEGQLTATPTDPKRRDHFYYDALGNRAGTNQVASMGDVNFNRRNNGLNQYLDWTPSVIYYDDNHPGPPPWVPPGNGVMMADGNITASFNALNQPMAIWSPVYNPNFLWLGFDPLGRCVKRWVGPANGNAVASNPATYYYYDGWNLVQEGASGFVADRSYVHGGRVDEIVASQDGAGGPWYNHHYDGQGNCIMLTTANGGLQEQYDYDAFGFPYFYGATGGKFTSAPHTRFLFTGREWLRDLRIYDYRARQYQPELGRFLQPDPKEFGAGDYNLYRYCHNDPVNKSDPTGLDARFIVQRDRSQKDQNRRDTPGIMHVYENGKYKASVRVNSNGYQNDDKGNPTHGLREGQYVVLPKPKSQLTGAPGEFKEGTPSVTGRDFLNQPGRAASDYKPTVRMHAESLSGQPDSRGCIAMPAQWANFITSIVNRQTANGESVTLQVVLPRDGSAFATPR